MDEYPEYDFYNSREECDGKKEEGREEGVARGGKQAGREGRNLKRKEKQQLYREPRREGEVKTRAKL